MAYLFPRVAFAPVRCAPVIRNDFAPLFSLFDDVTRQFERAARQQLQPTRRPFNPNFDLKEDKTSYILEGEVPGFKDADLSIEWNDNVLAIRGRQETVKESGKQPEVTETQAVEASTQDATPSDSGSVKSHQPTVEDEEPVTSSSTPVTEVTKTSTPEAPVTIEQPKPEVQRWISERTTGEFLRQFRFPSNAVEHEAIKASLQSGILKIVVPKAAAPASRRINIE